MPLTITRQSPAEIARSINANYYRQAYGSAVNVSQLLERMDPTEDYPNDDPRRNLDAYERVLMEMGIRTQPVPSNGMQASTWGDFVATEQGRAMAPEFMSRVWRRATNSLPYGMKQQIAAGETPANARAILLSGDLGAPGAMAYPWSERPELTAKRLVPPIPLARIVARETPIDGDAYRALYITDDFNSDAYRMKRVGEGAEIPTTTLVTGENQIRIHKFGRGLRATYEQLRRQRIDRIAFVIARMAIQAEVDKVSMAVQTIVSGDGNSNTAATTVAQSTIDPAATLTHLSTTGWWGFQLTFSLTYMPDVVLGPMSAIMQLLTLPVAQGNQVPLGLMPANAFGTLTPIANQFGATIAYGVQNDVPTYNLLAFQSGGTLERVIEVGGNVSEVERFISNQTQLLTITEVEGFAILDPNGSRLLNTNG